MWHSLALVSASYTELYGARTSLERPFPESRSQKLSGLCALRTPERHPSDDQAYHRKSPGKTLELVKDKLRADHSILSLAGIHRYMPTDRDHDISSFNLFPL